MAVPAITNNSPVAGSIAWGAFTIQYLDTAYAIAAGSTPNRWVWWRYNGGNSVIEAGPDVPGDLTDDDLVLFGNKNGIGVRVQSTSLIDGELLVDGSIFAEALSTNAITTEHLLAGDALVSGLLEVGATVSQAVATSGLTIGNQTWNTDTGLTIPDVVSFPATDALSALLWAKLIARELTIENYLKLQGSINEISQGASLSLANGVTPPTTKPTLTDDWEVAQQLTMTGAGTVADLRGLVRHPTDATSWFTLRQVDQYSCEVLKFTNGVLVLRKMVGGDAFNSNDGSGGIAFGPTQNKLYIAGSVDHYVNTAGVNSGMPDTQTFVSIHSVDLALTTVTQETQIGTKSRTYSGDGIWWNDGVQIYPYDNTYFMVGGYTPSQGGCFIGYLYEWAYGKSGKYYGDQILLDNSGTKFIVTGINYGKTAGDAANPDMYWTLWGKNVDPLLSKVLNSGGTMHPFPRAFGRPVVGSYQDTATSTFYSLDNTGTIAKYQTAPITGQVAYAFYDSDPAGTGLHETPLSPTATIATARGARCMVKAVPPPDTGSTDAPDQVSVVARTGTTGTFYRQGFIVPPLQNMSFAAIAQVTAYGAVATFASAGGSPSRIFSAVADALGSIIELKGDGSGRVGPWAWNAAGNPTRSATKSGVVNSGTLTAATPKTIAVTFATPFPSTGPDPIVTVSPIISGDPSTVDVSVFGVTTTGFSVRMRRTVATAYDANWIAVIPTQ